MNKKRTRKNKLDYIIERRIKIVTFLVCFCFAILVCYLFNVQVINTSKYSEQLDILTKNTIEGETAPRGRIYDRNGKIIVDNKPIKVIYYKKPSGITLSEEIKLAYKLSEILDLNINKLNKTNLKEFWLANNSNLANELITEEEWNNYNMRKLDNGDIYRLKLERITDEKLSIYNEHDKEAAYIYYLMNNGYSYSEKVIKKDDLTDLEYAHIASKLDELNGIYAKVDWERVYPYGDVFRSIVGNISKIPSEAKDYYLSKGYNLNDRVGISYLEYQYEDILKGEKDLFEINKNGENILIKEGKRGNDIILSIDIELQKIVEDILVSEIVKTKHERNSEYFDHSYVLISNPKTGEIIAMAGKQLSFKGNEYSVYDIAANMLTLPVTVGSVIKGASQTVGYNSGALKIDEVRDDKCIKLAGAPPKCSFSYYGKINDVKALKISSNTYQFNTAMKVAGYKYNYNMPFGYNEDAFNIYRNTFKEFGLGVKSEIDLPNESIGQIGKNDKLHAGLLLDFVIGQYDTYTTLQLGQYINTIANKGSRMKFNLLKSYYQDGELKEVEPQELSKLKTEDKYLNRVIEGFKAVMAPGGTGINYIESKNNPAGKTGTSQSFLDITGDNKIDIQTVTSTFAGYAPFDDPIASFVVVSPHVAHLKPNSSFYSWVNKRISREVSKKFFDIYK